MLGSFAGFIRRAASGKILSQVIPFHPCRLLQLQFRSSLWTVQCALRVRREQLQLQQEEEEEEEGGGVLRTGLQGLTMLGSPTFLRGLAAAGRGVGLQVSSSFATGPRQGDGTFYEFRTYTVKPDKMKDFLELTGKNIHLRTAHSPVVGYWTLEFGGLNKAFSIWKYDSFAQRTAVRAALAKDQEWQEKYMSRMLPLLNKQKNEIAYLVPWCDLGSSVNDGVYELVTFQMKPGGPSVWGQSFKGAVNAHVKTGYSKLIGVFHTEYGLLNRVHVLWWNENPDSRAAGRHHAHEDPRVVAAVRESVQFLESQKSLLLLPTGFSPLK